MNKRVNILKEQGKIFLGGVIFLRTGGLSTPEERPNSYYPIYFLPQEGKISLERISDEQIEILPLDSNGNKRVWRKNTSFLLKTC